LDRNKITSQITNQDVESLSLFTFLEPVLVFNFLEHEINFENLKHVETNSNHIALQGYSKNSYI